MAPPPPPTSRPAAASYSTHSRSLRKHGQEERGAKKTAPPERAASFHGRTATAAPPDAPRQMRRPKTQPDLLAGERSGVGRVGPWERRVPAKLLVNVTVQRSLGPVQVMASAEWTVADLVAAAVRLYAKEGRRPLLSTTDPSAFGLHYSQFSLQCLDPTEQLIGLGSRNFFLCPRLSPQISDATTAASTSSSSSSSSSPSCSTEAAKASKIVIPWLAFMDFLL